MPPELLEGQGNGSNTVDPDQAVIVAGAPAGTTVDAVETQELDVDDLSLDDLRKAVQAEERGDTPGQTQGEAQTDAGAGAGQPQGGQDDTGQQPQGKGPRNVPIERFNEVYRAAKERDLEIARLTGEVVALRSQQASAAPAVNPQAAQLEEQIVALAAKFDDGALTATEWKRQERALQNQLDQIRNDEIAAAAARRVQPAAPQPTQDYGFRQASRQIENQLAPFADLIPDEMFGGVVNRIRAEMAAEGIREIGENSEELLDFRRRVGEYAKAHAAEFSKLSGKPIPTVGGQQQQQRRPGTQQVTPDQRLAKLNLQESMPPNIHSMARAPGAAEAPLEEQLEGMDEEAIGALPDTVRNKLLGYTT